MISALRRHWPALILAFLAGFFLVLPPLWAKFRFGFDFSDPVNIRVNDEFFYLARMRDVIDGYPLSGNAYIWEHKSGPPGQPVFLGEYLAGKIIKFLELDVVSGGVLLDFALPVLAALLTYGCFFAVTKMRWLSLFGAALLFFWLFPGDFARVVSPQMNFLFWLSQFLLLWLLAGGEYGARARRFLIAAAALNFGLLFYIYTYYWTFYLAFFGIAFLLFFLLGAGDFAKAVAGIAAGGAVAAVPYFWMMARVFSAPEYAETVRRIGMIDSHFPSGINIIIPAFSLLAAAALLVRRGFLQWDRRLLFFASGALAAAASVNQHVVTGKNLEFSSHYYMLSAFWFAFFAAYLAGVFLHKKPGWSRWGAVSALVVAAAAAPFFLRENLPPKLLWPRAELKRYLPLFSWLDKNAKKDEVIYAPLAVSNLAPIYTASNVFFSSWARLSFMRDEEILERYALNSYYDDVDPEAAVRNVFGVQFLNAALHAAQENRVRRLLGLEPKPVIPLPPEAAERVMRRLLEVRQNDLYPALKRYRVDYVVWDKADQPQAGFGVRPPGEKLYDEGDLAVYRLR